MYYSAGVLNISAESNSNPVANRRNAKGNVFWRCLFLIAGLALQTAAFAREVIPLNDGWRFAKGEHPEALQPGFNDNQWETVQLPHDWSIFGPFDQQDIVKWDEFGKWVRWRKDSSQGYLPRGKGVYRKTFHAPAAWEGKKVYISFEGINNHSRVWLNGREVGTHLSGHVPVDFDLTPCLEPGRDNLLVLAVDATQKDEWWYQGGGIYRTACLHIKAPLHVDLNGVWVRPADLRPGSAVILADTELHNDSDVDAECRVTSIIRDAQGREAVRARGTASVKARGWTVLKQEARMKSPILWSVENPYLYSLETRVEKGGTTVDWVTNSFGLRTAWFDPDLGFMLNGRPVKLKGTAEHEGFAGVGTAVPDRLNIKRIEMLKEAGVNYMRAGGHSFSQISYEATDRLGMLASQETRYFDDTPWGQQMLAELLKRFREHPSIILWGLGNEESLQGTPEGAKILRRLHELVHEYDPSANSYIIQSGEFNRAGFNEITDVQGYNYVSFADMDSDHQNYPNRRFIVSEYNYTYDDLWQKEFETRLWLSGGSIWSGFAYKGELNWPNKNWPGTVYNLDGSRAGKFHALQKAFLGIDSKPEPVSKQGIAALRLEPDRVTLASGGQDAVVVFVSLRDADGAVVNATNRIEFEVSGEGKLLGVSNADTASPELDKQSWRSAFAGRCTAIVSSTTRPGKFTLTARAEGNLSASFEFATRSGVSPWQALPQVLEIRYQDDGQPEIRAGAVRMASPELEPDETALVSASITNHSAVYPVVMSVRSGGRMLAQRDFAVPVGTAREIRLPVGKFYDPGLHVLDVVLSKNGRQVLEQRVTFAVKQTSAKLKVLELAAPDYALPGEAIPIRIRAQNIGGSAAGPEPVMLRVNDDQFPSRPVALKPGETGEIRFEIPMDRTGQVMTYRLRALDSPEKRILVMKPFTLDQIENVEIHGAPKVVEGGIMGAGLKLNSSEDYLKVKNLDLRSKRFTLTAWFKADAMVGPSKSAPLFSGDRLCAMCDWEKPLFTFFDGGDYWGNAHFSENRWHFVAFVFDYEIQPGVDTSKEEAFRCMQRVYVNGRLDGQRPGKMFKGSLEYIGSFRGEKSLAGVLDDVRVYDQALSASEIRLLYRDPAQSKVKPLIWLSFDQDAAAATRSPFKGVLNASTLKVTSSSKSPWCSGPEKLVDDEGVTHNLELPGTADKDMWLSSGEDRIPWVKVDLGAVQKLATLRIWNYNQSGWTMRGTKELEVYCADGDADPDEGKAVNPASWTLVQRIQDLPKAQGTPLSPTAAEVSFKGRPVRWIVFRLTKAWGDSGFHDVGLGHLQFVTDGNQNGGK